MDRANKLMDHDNKTYSLLQVLIKLLQKEQFKKQQKQPVI